MACPAFQENHVPENFQVPLIPPAMLLKDAPNNVKDLVDDTYLPTPDKQQVRKGISPGLK